ncbi:MAG TPA: oxidoreductase [Mycobacteriales bacterium]|jgi:NAD(P)-dependent dehydrogenase (short-subunit alcohol dehydrogenase family)|nr:oxidoreductase [Mycobacteriales bacterium]
MTERVWFITGASRGLGRAFAEAALAAGDRVAATARRVEDLGPLIDEYGERVQSLTLDVTDRSAVFAAVADALRVHGRIDVAVNNAGYGLSGAVEEVSEAQARHQLDVNVLGALWCTQAVLPPMRAQRSGHIFQISSLGGVVAFLNGGLYNASKWALEGFSESLAQEVAGFGIHVTLVEPGPFRTDWNGTSMVRAEPMAAYDDVLRERRRQMSGEFANTQPGDPRQAAQALLTVLDAADPPRRLLLGKLAADVAPKTYHARLDQWQQWDEIARNADFPASSPTGASG